MIVRPARQEDVPAIVEIVERCGLGVDGLDYSQWAGIVLVAVRQSEVVGFVAALPAKPYAVITEIGVLPEHQKGRACTELMKAIELALRLAGCTAWAGYVGESRGLDSTLKSWGAESTGVGSMWVRRL